MLCNMIPVSTFPSGVSVSKESKRNTCRYLPFKGGKVVRRNYTHILLLQVFCLSPQKKRKKRRKRSLVTQGRGKNEKVQSGRNS